MYLENITKIYHLQNQDIPVLTNISYSFKKGKFYAIIGHSGCGKTTLLNILGLIEKATSGTYKINNDDVSKLSDKELSQLRMKKIGFIFQDYYLDDKLKAHENIILPMIINENIPKKSRKERALKLLEQVGLSERANHYPNEMSGGEQQRVAIARCLANDPDTILADEPTGNLDKENEKYIFTELKNLSNNGKCVIVVSHSSEVREYADVIINLDNGKLAISNEP